MAKKQKPAGKKIKKTRKKAEDLKEYNPTEPLMPELEELVRKNPNRLIGCGG